MKILLALLLCAITTSVLAGEGAAAQLTQEERNWLRERWRLASPEERLMMRRQFQEMLQTLTPDPHSGAGLVPWLGVPPPSPADIAGAASNFGAGFEQRRPDRSGAPNPDPAGWFWR